MVWNSSTPFTSSMKSSEPKMGFYSLKIEYLDPSHVSARCAFLIGFVVCVLLETADRDAERDN